MITRPETRYQQANLKGVNTPWREDYELDEKAFSGQVERLLENDYRHIYVLGTAGEGYAIADTAYRRIVDVFCDLMDGPDLFPQIGVITLSPDHAMERIAYGLSRGATTFQIVLPSWGVMSSGEKIDYFKHICGAFGEAQFLHYNYPSAVNVMSAADYENAIDEVPNLVATKISTMDMSEIRSLMARAGELQHFFLQGPFPYGCLHGECSLISSLGPVFPNLSRRLFESGRDGDLATAFAIQKRMIEVASGLYAGVDGPHIDGAFDKLTSWLVDPTFPRRLLPPFRPLSDEAAEVAKRYLETFCTDIS